jgi:hypothetical protein
MHFVEVKNVHLSVVEYQRLNHRQILFNSIIEMCTKFCWEILILIRTKHKYWALYTVTYMHLRALRA